MVNSWQAFEHFYQKKNRNYFIIKQAKQVIMCLNNFQHNLEHDCTFLDKNFNLFKVIKYKTYNKFANFLFKKSFTEY